MFIIVIKTRVEEPQPSAVWCFNVFLFTPHYTQLRSVLHQHYVIKTFHLNLYEKKLHINVFKKSSICFLC